MSCLCVLKGGSYRLTTATAAPLSSSTTISVRCFASTTSPKHPKRSNGKSKTTNTTTTPAAPTPPIAIKSKRQAFRETPVPSSIHRYIEMIGVGIPSNRRKQAKNRRNDLFRSLEEGRRTGRTGSYTKPPPPFSSSSFGEGNHNNSIGDGTDNAAASTKRVVVIGSVATADDTFPTNKEFIPEVALAGRSNVGKSTLLNALLYGNQARKSRPGGSHDDDDRRDHNPLVRTFRRGTTPENVKMPKGIKAKTSDKPGETRKITFYQLSSSSSGSSASSSRHQVHDDNENLKSQHQQQQQVVKIRLVDLPGFGFSFTPRDHDGFRALISKYLLERGKALKRVLLLVDARHGMKRADVEFLVSLQDEARTTTTTTTTIPNRRKKIPPVQIVLTKCDLVSRDDLARRVVLVRQQLSDTLRRETGSLPVLLVSARAGVGFNNIRQSRSHHRRAKGGILELQKELAALVVPNSNGNNHNNHKKPLTVTTRHAVELNDS